MSNREKFLEKPLPSSEDSERAILGAILLDNDLMAEASEHVTASDFYSPMYRRIFGAMHELYNTSRPIDAILIGEELKKTDSLESIGGVAAIANLTYGLPHFSDLSEYLTLVREKSVMRRLIRICNSITTEVLEEDSTLEQLLASAEQQIFSLANSTHQSSFEQLRELVATAIDLSRQRSSSTELLIGLSTGYTDLDLKLQGLKNGDLLILAARPSVGKTVLATNLAQNVSIRDGRTVAFFSLEMSKAQLANRIIASEATVDNYRFNIGHLSDSEWDGVEEIRNSVSDTKLFIDDTAMISVPQIRSKVRRLSQQQGRVDLIVIDYLQLMGSGDVRFRQAEIAEISRSLKLTAREFDCPVLALSQLNRESEKRANHRPNLSDLRESGAIEQDADVVMFIYREDLYLPDPSMHTNISEIIIAKNRQGAIGTSRVQFDGAHNSFRDVNIDTGDF